MGRGNARFGCPRGTHRITDCSALHYHVYVDYEDLNDQESFDNRQLEIVNHIKGVCEGFYEFPEDKWLDRDCKVIAESSTHGVAVADNEWSQAVFFYAKEGTDLSDEDLDREAYELAVRICWEMRHLTLRQRTCAWTSRDYKGTPTST